MGYSLSLLFHNDVIKWKHFPRYWFFVRGIHLRRIHRSPVNSPYKGQLGGTSKFSLIYAWTSDWVNNRKAGDLTHNNAHYDATVMLWPFNEEPIRRNDLLSDFASCKTKMEVSYFATACKFILHIVVLSLLFRTSSDSFDNMGRYNTTYIRRLNGIAFREYKNCQMLPLWKKQCFNKTWRVQIRSILRWDAS